MGPDHACTEPRRRSSSCERRCWPASRDRQRCFGRTIAIWGPRFSRTMFGKAHGPEQALWLDSESEPMAVHILYIGFSDDVAVKLSSDESRSHWRGMSGASSGRQRGDDWRHDRRLQFIRTSVRSYPDRMREVALPRPPNANDAFKIRQSLRTRANALVRSGEPVCVSRTKLTRSSQASREA